MRTPLSFLSSVRRSVCSSSISSYALFALMIGLVFVAVPALGQGRGGGGVINEAIKLLANDGAARDNFGWSSAIDNGVIAIGVVRDDDNGFSSGSAYLFDAFTGSQILKLLPNDGSEIDLFGSSIAIDDGIVAVGAMFDDENGEFSGSAYLFDVSTGVQMLKLLPGDGAANDRFGGSIAIDKGIIAVGSSGDDDNGSSSGSVYLFDASTGVQISKLLPSDGEEFDSFGTSVAIDNGIVVIGAAGDDDNGIDSGSAYIFDVLTGVQISKIFPSHREANNRFGNSIAIDNGVIAVGVSASDYFGVVSGSAYLFDASTGDQFAKLVPDNGEGDNFFGASIAMDNGIVVVGANWDDDNGVHSGSAYIYNASTGIQIAKLLPGDGAAADEFGYSVAIDKGIVVAGAVFDNDNGTRSGSAYVFNGNCPADLTGDWVVDTLDFFLFAGLFAFGDPRADLTNNGIVDVMDFLEFVNLFVIGCP